VTAAPLLRQVKVTVASAKVAPGTGSVVSGVPRLLSTSNAALTSIRGLVIPFRGSRIGTLVFWRAARISLTDADGFACLSKAKVPATWGAAIEVPVRASTPGE
jgi:hypothetical protein